VYVVKTAWSQVCFVEIKRQRDGQTDRQDHTHYGA